MRYTAILLSIILVISFGFGLLIEPTSSLATPKTNWTGYYYANPNFEGEPAITVADDVIEMNWFTDAPFEALPVDFFSVRWQTIADFTDDVYRFRAGADDGIRVYIDDKLIIDAYQDGTFRTLTQDVAIPAGSYTLTVEYYESTGLAGVLLDWQVAPRENIVEVIDFETLTTEVIRPAAQPISRIATAATPLLDAPHINALPITSLHVYQPVTLISVDSSGDWYHVQISETISGWVPAHALYASQQNISDESLQDPSLTLQGQTITETTIQTSDGAVTISPNTSLNIISRDNTGLKAYVETDNGVSGWIFSPYIELIEGNLQILPIR